MAKEATITGTIDITPTMDGVSTMACLFSDQLIEAIAPRKRETARKFIGNVIEMSAVLASRGEYDKLNGLLKYATGDETAAVTIKATEPTP